MSGSEIVCIGDERAQVRLLPGVGGSVSAFTSAAGADWFRRTDESRASDPRKTACFPMVPFSNRIENGRFLFEGTSVALAPNVEDEAFPIHGSGWQSPWTVAEHSTSAARLTYRHEPGEWPWQFQCEQHFACQDGALALNMTLQNLGETPMPGGLGSHPYFSNPADAVLRTDVEAAHICDHRLMPIHRDAHHPAIAALRAGDPLPIGLNLMFEGWSGVAEILWPRAGRGLRITASPSLPYLLVYTPPGADFFCVEPISHCVNAFNLAPEWGDTGLVRLAPAESLTASVRFDPLV